MHTILSGLEVLLKSKPSYLAGKRLGLLCNPASVDKNFNHSRILINRAFPTQLTTLFSPQHGFFAEKQDNMIESNHITDPALNIPVYSLYGEHRKPLKEMFENIDVLLIDIQDVGTRVYTFIYTIAYCMETAAETGVKVIILDRPNPVGGNVTEGNILNPEFSSFVGRFPIPMRHGLTAGEISKLFNTRFDLGCDLDVIPMDGWRRAMYFNDTGLPWVAPSPNLPTLNSASVYPGQVIFEGTNISEGRGTTQPFEFFGAPFLNTSKIKKIIESLPCKGFHLREIAFEPVSGKWQNEICKGFQLHISDKRLYEPYITSLVILKTIIELHSDQFEYKNPPYEYEYNKLPFDLICGDNKIREMIESNEDPGSLKKSWQKDLFDYRKITRDFLIYT